METEPQSGEPIVCQQVFDNIQAGVIIHGPDGRVLLCNSYACRLMGLSSDQILGRTPMDPQWKFFSEEGAQLHPHEFPISRVLATGRPIERYVGRVLQPDGSEVWVQGSAQLVFDAQGVLAKVVMTLIDITNRKLYRQALLEQQDQYRSIFNNAPVGIFRSNFEGQFLEVNPALSSMLGFDSPAQVLHEIYSIQEQIYVRRDDRYQILAEQLHTPDTSKHLNHYRRKDGTEFIANLYLRTVRDAEGNSQFLEGIVEDVTEFYKVQEQVKRYQEHLEELVEERTHNLTLANQDLEAFSYTISHDLRAPLRAIGSYSQILQHDYASHLDTESRRLLTSIHRNVARMNHMLEDLLVYSRMNLQELEFHSINIDKLVRNIVRDLQEAHPSRQIDYQIGELPASMANAIMIRQVFYNLINNSVKYTRPRDLAVIEIGSTEQEGRLVYFVRDNGVGFDMKYVDNLFKVFHRLHTEEQFEGTGIGLAIVSRVIARHRGRIWVESVIDQGTTFYFTLG